MTIPNCMGWEREHSLASCHLLGESPWTVSIIQYFEHRSIMELLLSCDELAEAAKHLYHLQ